MENTIEVPLKTKNRTIETPYDPAIPCLCRYPEKTNPKRYMHCNVHSSTIYNSQGKEEI